MYCLETDKDHKIYGVYSFRTYYCVNLHRSAVVCVCLCVRGVVDRAGGAWSGARPALAAPGGCSALGSLTPRRATTLRALHRRRPPRRDPDHAVYNYTYNMSYGMR